MPKNNYQIILQDYADTFHDITTPEQEESLFSALESAHGIAESAIFHPSEALQAVKNIHISQNGNFILSYGRDENNLFEELEQLDYNKQLTL